MIKNVLSLIVRSVFVLMGTGFLTFCLLWHSPGDPAEAIAMARYNDLVSQEVIDIVRQEAGLNSGFWSAFISWSLPLLRLDFGRSMVSGQNVIEVVFGAISYTFPLALAGLAIGTMVALPLAIIATKRPGGMLDRFAVATALMGTAIPPFWLGLLLILLFTVQLGLLPAMGARTASHAILPAITLGLGVAASLTRIMRSSILEAKSQPFLPALRRRGVSAKAIGKDHVIPHAAIPVVTILGLELAFLLEGIIMVEVIFSRPGLGTLLLSAIEARNFPMVQAVVLLTAVVFVFINLLIDVFYQILDPRIGESNA